MLFCTSAVSMGTTERKAKVILVLTSALACGLSDEEVSFKYIGQSGNRSQAEALCAALHGVLPAPQSWSAHVRLGGAITAAGKDQAWLQFRRHEIRATDPGGLEQKPSRCGFYHASGESNRTYNSSCHATHVKKGPYFWSLCQKQACSCDLAFAKSVSDTCLQLDDSCVFFGNSHTSWVKNRLHCPAHGMQMVAAKDQVLANLNRGIRQQKSLMTGRLYPLDYRTHIYTSDDGKEPEESFWSEEDDNSTSDCVANWHYTWTPRDCAEEHAVICEFQNKQTFRGNHSETYDTSTLRRDAEALPGTPAGLTTVAIFMVAFIITTVALSFYIYRIKKQQRAPDMPLTGRRDDL